MHPTVDGEDRAGAPSLADVGEFGLLRRILPLLNAPAPPAGPGDDAAVLPVTGAAVLATTDVAVEGVHFRLDWSTPYQVGRKVAAANLADISAMGGRPTGLLLGLVAPGTTSVQAVADLMAGLRDEAATLGSAVIGGDTVSGPCLVLAVTALGEPSRVAGVELAPVTRAGARPGDIVVLVGEPGRSAAGLRLLRSGIRAGDLVAAHQVPQPPYLAGPQLAAAGATALCDVSDGLIVDLGRLAAASGVGMELDGIECPAGVRGVEVWTGGEDHVLVATLPPEGDRRRWPPAARVIGRVVAGRGLRLPVQAAGFAQLGGFEHFAPAAPEPPAACDTAVGNP